jgi:hypothetical protein
MTITQVLLTGALALTMTWALPASPLGAYTWGEAARDAGIPEHVLFAIAQEESGRTRAGGVRQPWPWAMNVQGKPRYYPNEEQTLVALRRLVTRGKRAIDVGLMQISYRYYGGRAGTLATLVRPEDNLRLAAVILAECRLRMGETYRAILSCYHQGRLTRRGVAYARRVLQKARKLSPESLVSVRHLSGLSAQVKTAPAAVRTIRSPSGGRQAYARAPGPHGNKRRRH